MMTGVIWIVQLVHYPAFKYVHDENFTAFQKFHMRRISYVVMPLMLVELISLCFIWKSDLLNNINALFLFGTWLATFFLSMPCHSSLAKKRSTQTINKLVISNWPRTLLWSMRLLLLLKIKSSS